MSRKEKRAAMFNTYRWWRWTFYLADTSLKYIGKEVSYSKKFHIPRMM
jgi:hypothetical protein